MKYLREWEINPNDFDNLASSGEKIQFLLSFAVLAPSTHNSQPWKFAIHDDRCEIYTDPAIKIVEADPKGRDLYISLGCLLENLIIASSYFGVFDKVDYTINRKKNSVAVVYFKNLHKSHHPRVAKYESLLGAITKRATIRGIFKPDQINRKIIDKVNNANDFTDLKLHMITGEDKIESLSKLTSKGLLLAYNRKSFRKEMSKWFVTPISNRPEGLPTYSLNMPFLLSLVFPLLVRFINVGKKVSSIIYQTVKSAPLICIISSDKDNELAWLQTGQLGERIMLMTTSDGLKNSIFVASIEMGDLYKNVQTLIGTKQVPHFLFCTGYMNAEIQHTPRHSIDNKLINAPALSA